MGIPKMFDSVNSSGGYYLPMTRDCPPFNGFRVAVEIIIGIPVAFFHDRDIFIGACSFGCVNYGAEAFLLSLLTWIKVYGITDSIATPP